MTKKTIKKAPAKKTVAKKTATKKPVARKTTSKTVYNADGVRIQTNKNGIKILIK